MSKIQCFKIKRGTGFDKAVKQHFELLPRWKSVFEKVNELLGENIDRMGTDTKILYVDVTQIKKDENKKLFTKDGKIKKNLKKALDINRQYQAFVREEGLEKFQEIHLIKFSYGVMRFAGQHMESYRTAENDLYFKTDFDLAERTNGLVTPITESEYHEKYLEELKKVEESA